MHGTWKVTGGGPEFPVVRAVALVLAAAVVYALAKILLWLGIIAVALIILAVIAAIVMRRRYPDYSPVVAEQAAALRAEVSAPKAAPAVVNHYHLHVAPGASAEGVNWALPLRDAVNRED